MSFSGKLRSNYRAADELGDLGNVLLGSDAIAGSFFTAAAGGVGGASFTGGGLLVGSFASEITGVGFHAMSAQGIISAFYGAVPGVNGSGWKVFLFDVMDMSTDGGSSVNVIYGFSATGALASNDSVIVVTLKKAVGSAASFTVVGASQISVHFLYTGFIVSAAS